MDKRLRDGLRAKRQLRQLRGVRTAKAAPVPKSNDSLEFDSTGNAEVRRTEHEGACAAGVNDSDPVEVPTTQRKDVGENTLLKRYRRPWQLILHPNNSFGFHPLSNGSYFLTNKRGVSATVKQPTPVSANFGFVNQSEKQSKLQTERNTGCEDSMDVQTSKEPQVSGRTTPAHQGHISDSFPQPTACKTRAHQLSSVGSSPHGFSSMMSKEVTCEVEVGDSSAQFCNEEDVPMMCDVDANEDLLFQARSSACSSIARRSMGYMSSGSEEGRTQEEEKKEGSDAQREPFYASVTEHDYCTVRHLSLSSVEKDETSGTKDLSKMANGLHRTRSPTSHEQELKFGQPRHDHKDHDYLSWKCSAQKRSIKGDPCSTPYQTRVDKSISPKTSQSDLKTEDRFSTEGRSPLSASPATIDIASESTSPQSSSEHDNDGSSDSSGEHFYEGAFPKLSLAAIANLLPSVTLSQGLSDKASQLLLAQQYSFCLALASQPNILVQTFSSSSEKSKPRLSDDQEEDADFVKRLAPIAALYMKQGKN